MLKCKHAQIFFLYSVTFILELQKSVCTKFCLNMKMAWKGLQDKWNRKNKYQKITKSILLAELFGQNLAVFLILNWITYPHAQQNFQRIRTSLKRRNNRMSGVTTTKRNCSNTTKKLKWRPPLRIVVNCLTNVGSKKLIMASQSGLKVKWGTQERVPLMLRRWVKTH